MLLLSLAGAAVLGSELSGRSSLRMLLRAAGHVGQVLTSPVQNVIN